MSIRRRLVLATGASFAALMLSASGAAAALPVGGGDVASHLSTQLLHWASLIIIPTAAIMALPALFKRDIGHALVTLAIVLVVGAFAFDAHGVQRFVEEIAEKVLN